MRQWPDAVVEILLASQRLLQTLFRVVIRSGIRKLVVGFWFALAFSLLGLPSKQYWGPNGAHDGFRDWTRNSARHQISAGNSRAATEQPVQVVPGLTDPSRGTAMDSETNSDPDAASATPVFRVRRSAGWWL